MESVFCICGAPVWQGECFVVSRLLVKILACKENLHLIVCIWNLYNNLSISAFPTLYKTFSFSRVKVIASKKQKPDAVMSFARKLYAIKEELLGLHHPYVAANMKTSKRTSILRSYLKSHRKSRSDAKLICSCIAHRPHHSYQARLGLMWRRRSTTEIYSISM